MTNSSGGPVNGNLQCCYRDNMVYNLYNRFYVPKTYHYAVEGRWDKIPNRLLKYKKEAIYQYKYPPYDTALHRIVRSSFGEIQIRKDSDINTLQQLDTIKINAIQSLLNASNNTITIMKDTFGRTPLHLSCMDICIDQIPILLLKININTVSMIDHEHRTPLHLLCARNTPIIPMNVLCIILETYPIAVLMEDITGDNPIQIIQLRRNDISNVNEVITLLNQYEIQLNDKGITCPPPLSLNNGIRTRNNSNDDNVSVTTAGSTRQQQQHLQRPPRSHASSSESE